jgi:predicted nucleic-acid-binding Zn-ribbon protein
MENFDVAKLHSFNCIKCLNTEAPFVNFQATSTETKNVAIFVLKVFCKRCSYHIEMLTADAAESLQ